LTQYTLRHEEKNVGNRILISVLDPEIYLSQVRVVRDIFAAQFTAQHGEREWNNLSKMCSQHFEHTGVRKILVKTPSLYLEN
jgi:hypothetical protein